MTWVLFSSGTGPSECELAVAGLVEKFVQEATRSGFTPVVIDTREGDHGPLSVLLSVDQTPELDNFLREWTGTIKWICQSPIRKSWQRKNWFVSVTVLAEPAKQDVLSERDIKVETMRASGPGGQHVNKTDSAVRMTHIPTGIVVNAREERSQHRNRALAMARLLEAILAIETRNEKKTDNQLWQAHNDLERGNAIRVYKGKSFQRVVNG